MEKDSAVMTQEGIETELRRIANDRGSEPDLIREAYILGLDQGEARTMARAAEMFAAPVEKAGQASALKSIAVLQRWGYSGRNEALPRSVQIMFFGEGFSEESVRVTLWTHGPDPEKQEFDGKTLPDALSQVAQSMVGETK